MVRCFFITSPKTSPETSPFIASYALLRRWERLWVGERSSGARPLGRFACKEWRRLLHCCLCAVAGGNAIPPLREPATWNSSPRGGWEGFPNMVGCLMSCLVRCLVSTSPLRRPVYKGFSRILVRCRPLSRRNFTDSEFRIKNKNLSLFLVNSHTSL